MTWLRKLLEVDKPDISIDTILDATNGPHKIPRGWFTSFSGVDVKIYFEDDESNFICVPEIQVVNCVCEPSGKVQGSIITLLFDGDVLSSLPMKPKNILMVAANEYGTLCYTRFKNIKFGVKKWNVSIDDIVTEIFTEFSAESYVSWKKIEGGPGKGEETSSSLPEQILEKLRRFK